MLHVLAMKCCTKMPCRLPHNHYCCLLSSHICLPHLLICTCLISSRIACPPSSVLCWCLLRCFLFLNFNDDNSLVFHPSLIISTLWFHQLPWYCYVMMAVLCTFLSYKNTINIFSSCEWVGYNNRAKIMATLILYLRSNWHVLPWSANSFDMVFSSY